MTHPPVRSYDGVDAPTVRKPRSIVAADAEIRVRGCTCFRARRLARRVTQIYDRLLAPCGLRVTQFSLISALMWQDGQAMGALAALLDMDRTTLTRNLKPLLDAGLVSLVRSRDDARQREVRITAAGRVRHVEARRLWRLAQNEINKTIGLAEVASLHRLFDDLVETLQHHDAPPAPRRRAPTGTTP